MRPNEPRGLCCPCQGVLSTDTHFLVAGSIMPVCVCVYIYIFFFFGPPNWYHTIYTVLYFFSFLIDTLRYALFTQAFLHPWGLATGTLATLGGFAELGVRASPALAAKPPVTPCCR